MICNIKTELLTSIYTACSKSNTAYSKFSAARNIRDPKGNVSDISNYSFMYLHG